MEQSENAPVRMAELGRVAAEAHRATADAQAAAAEAGRWLLPPPSQEIPALCRMIHLQLYNARRIWQ